VIVRDADGRIIGDGHGAEIIRDAEGQVVDIVRPAPDTSAADRAEARAQAADQAREQAREQLETAAEDHASTAAAVRREIAANREVLAAVEQLLPPVAEPWDGKWSGPMLAKAKSLLGIRGRVEIVRMAWEQMNPDGRAAGTHHYDPATNTHTLRIARDLTREQAETAIAHELAHASQSHAWAAKGYTEVQRMAAYRKDKRPFEDEADAREKDLGKAGVQVTLSE
jgi:hypothetical protein